VVTAIYWLVIMVTAAFLVWVIVKVLMEYTA